MLKSSCILGGFTWKFVHYMFLCSCDYWFCLQTLEIQQALPWTTNVDDNASLRFNFFLGCLGFLKRRELSIIIRICNSNFFGREVEPFSQFWLFRETTGFFHPLKLRWGFAILLMRYGFLSYFIMRFGEVLVYLLSRSYYADLLINANKYDFVKLKGIISYSAMSNWSSHV